MSQLHGLRTVGALPPCACCSGTAAVAGQSCAAADLQKAKLESKALCGLVLCGYRWDVQVEYHKATMVGAHAAPLLVNLRQLVVGEPAAQSMRGCTGRSSCSTAAQHSGAQPAVQHTWAILASIDQAAGHSTWSAALRRGLHAYPRLQH